MSETLQSREYKPNAEKCCERCVFGTGAHANWCPIWADALTRAYLWKEQQAKMRQDFDRLFSHARDA